MAAKTKAKDASAPANEPAAPARFLVTVNRVVPMPSVTLRPGQDYRVSAAVLAALGDAVASQTPL